MKSLALAAMAAALASPAAAQPVQQLRIYEIFDGNKQAFHDRFRDHGARIMARHGFKVLSMWDSRFDGKTEFVYLLEWKDEPTMKAAWAAFMADPEWAEIKRVTGAQHGRLVGAIQDRTLRLTDYSPTLTSPPAR
ncbi:NIPSNAP family protein [Phenylobacterium sp. RIFCSPHIGHO2_01_FULL_69_31]|uniref:NIPSNAP family protein n=1 Tax=Phenylobacterium sp. RIFCSPHIGHO2_01_FULL_69_31 TaxID=1801944 RepID=UPI000B2979EB|nr:NIPSNAP family protein [Phenylobacterium sp. RIFCSPHIGHO2_01_FULL_69_31]